MNFEAAGLRGEPQAQEQKSLEVGECSQAVWSEATKTTTDPLSRATGPF